MRSGWKCIVDAPPVRESHGSRARDRRGARRGTLMKRGLSYRMRARILLGALLGEVWGMAGFALLMVPAVREPVAAWLGGAAPFVLALFPMAWLLPFFSDYVGRGLSQLFLPGAASVLAGTLAGMFLAWAVYRIVLRRRAAAQARQAAADRPVQKVGRSWGWYKTSEDLGEYAGIGTSADHKASAD